MIPTKTPVVFVHIPKNGGSTLWGMFYKTFGHECAVRMNMKRFDSRMERERYIYEILPTFEQQNVKIFGGHFALLPDLAQRYPHFTILREPVSRVISKHYFRQALNKDTPQAASSLSLEEGVQQSVDNEQIRYLINVFDRPLTPADLEQAKFNLEHHFAAFGILERYNESLMLFKRTFDWPTPYYLVKNTGTNKPKSVSDEARRIAAEHNALDIELYEWACDLFARRIAAQPPDFAREVARFERMLPLWTRWRTLRESPRYSPILKFARRVQGKIQYELKKRSGQH